MVIKDKNKNVHIINSKEDAIERPWVGRIRK